MDINDATIEELDEELRLTLNEIDKIAIEVAEGRLDAYGGFMQTEKYNEKLSEIRNKLRDMGVDITSLTQNY